jgi:hypothetical protein
VRALTHSDKNPRLTKMGLDKELKQKIIVSIILEGNLGRPNFIGDILLKVVLINIAVLSYALFFLLFFCSNTYFFVWLYTYFLVWFGLFLLVMNGGEQNTCLRFVLLCN